MAVDLLLPILHHLLVFGLVGALAAEIAVVRPNLKGEQIDDLGTLDTAYSSIAGLIVLVGFGEVFDGARPPAYFLANPLFWAKVGCFILVIVISVPPTLRIASWRRQRSSNPSFTVPSAEAIALRRFMITEAALLLPILVCAAMMVRGYGY